MRSQTELPIVTFSSRKKWEVWVSQQNMSSKGLWMKLAKKGSGIASVTYAEAVEVALCYGWIDGQARGLDDDYYLQRFAPRRARSKWSKINRSRAEGLIESGAMKPTGLSEVERARADGRWDAAYDAPSTATVPDDLRRELENNDKARGFFESLNATNRYAILHRIQDAKRPETRARRIEKFVAMLEREEKIYP
ncbi:MAG: YdeI/OmpD-associated family protein [Actinomycetota bacterium]|nr:YdeI/OmpD-associated family protein [Actinomycetota bacterium]